jgi:hypothetical protein
MQRLPMHCGVVISALGIMSGCTTSVTIPVTELPLLSTPRVRALANWPEVTTTTGEKEVIVGTIEKISIERLRVDMVVVPPFGAWNRGPVVEVVHPFGRKFITWADNPTVVVQYDDLARRRVVAGSILGGLGVSTLLFGLAGFIATRGDSPPHFETTVAVLTLMGVGVGLMIPGGFLVFRSPEKPHLSARSSAPMLMIGKNAVGVGIAF